MVSLLPICVKLHPLMFFCSNCYTDKTRVFPLIQYYELKNSVSNKRYRTVRGKSIRNRFFLNIQMRNMGGGKKKQSLKKMEDAGKKKERKESKSKESATEKKSVGIVSPDPKNQVVTDKLKKMKVLTPYTVATRFNLRLSVAKTFLKELEKQGVVKFISGSKNTKIYKPAD